MLSTMIMNIMIDLYLFHDHENKWFNPYNENLLLPISFSPHQKNVSGPFMIIGQEVGFIHCQTSTV